MRWLLPSASLLTLAAFVSAAPAPKVKKEHVAREQVQRLFADLRAEKWRHDGRFPALGWEHVPALLELADSRATLRDFPGSVRGSALLSESPEGVVALWLIEGIRLGGKYPARDPALFEVGPGVLAAEDGHGHGARAYRDWWKKVKDLPPAKRAADPLEGTGLDWLPFG